MDFEPLVSLVRARIRQQPDRPAMRYRAADGWHSLSYGTVGTYLDAVASWLVAAGVAPGDRVVILAPNSPWWSIADLAVQAAGAVPVPIYPTSAPATAAHIVRETQARVAFVGGPEHAATLAGSHAEPLDHLVSFGVPIAPGAARAVHRLADLLATPPWTGLADRAALSSADDLATIVYTSGTTGEPKGVMLTHANFQPQFRALDALFDVTPADRSLCFLPLSHAYERAWTYYVLTRGAENIYLEDPKAVAATLREVWPTCMVSVPRLYEKVYATVRHGAEQSPLKRQLLDWALRIGTRVERARVSGEGAGPALRLAHAVADRLVLRKIRDAVGGPKTVFSAGGAALAAEIEGFFFAAGLLVSQGYGLTETAPMLTCNNPRAFRFGTVGQPIPGTEIRIAPDGEIQARGPNVTSGYFRRPEDTRAAFSDGWFCTGDIGEFDADGFLRITDRKKDLIITSGGKNIAPSRIESVIGQDYYVEQVATVGEGRHYLAALVVPQFEALEQWARDRGILYESPLALVQDARVVSFMAERIAEQQAVLAEFERVKRFTLLPERFSTAGGEITPTLKNIRSAIAQKYADVIEGMYRSEHTGGS